MKRFWIVLVLAACGAEPPRTPTDAARAFVEAFLSLDKDALEACTLATDEERAALFAMVDFLAAGRRFKASMIGAYGESGWESFQDAEHSRVILASPGDIDVDALRTEQRGHVAFARVGDRRQPLRIERKNGAWFVPARQFMGEELATARIRFERLTACLERFHARIGAPDVTAESLDAEMAAPLVLAMRATGG